MEPVERRLRIRLGGRTIADTVSGYRVLETSHPPNYYLPPGDVEPGCLVRIGRSSVCEWKGTAQYFDVRASHVLAPAAAWCYEHPSPRFVAIAGYVAFYPAPMDACLVDDEVATPQPGGFYGGWITEDLVGPFKGSPGSAGW